MSGLGVVRLGNWARLVLVQVTNRACRVSGQFLDQRQYSVARLVLQISALSMGFS
jgi:hypothetical protein